MKDFTEQIMSRTQLQGLIESGIATEFKTFVAFDKYENPEYIEAFKIGNKYFLKFFLIKRYSCNRKNGKLYVLYHSPLYNTFVKEFDNKVHANAYFKKVASGKQFSVAR